MKGINIRRIFFMLDFILNKGIVIMGRNTDILSVPVATDRMSVLQNRIYALVEYSHESNVPKHLYVG